MLPLRVFSQEINDNTILVGDITFEKIVNMLLDSGYKTEKIDKEFYTVKTEFKNICANCIPQLLLDIRVKDGTATITGIWRTNAGLKVTSNHPETGEMKNAYTYPIKNENMKIAHLCFEQMNAFAKSFGKPITYLKK